MNITKDNLDDHLEAHFSTVADEEFEASGKSFAEIGFGLIPYALPDPVKKIVADEVLDLTRGSGIRRDLQLGETSGTHRKMRNVTAEEIRARAGWVDALYWSEPFREALARVAGEPVEICPYLPERYIITSLEKSGDTHGWHWDDYSFAVIFVAECPPLELGGFGQTVSGTSWDKENPEVFRKLVDNVIRSHALVPGDLYLLRTDTTLHQVHPLLGGSRTIVNMAYAGRRDAGKQVSHETMEELFRT